MSGLTAATSAAVLDDQLGTTVRTAPTTPMKLSVETVAGTTTAAGTELASTTRPSITFAASTGTAPVAASNNAQVTVVAGSAGTVVAAAIYDSAATPVRKAWGALASSRTVASGDSLVFAVGAVTLSLAS